ncbi:hypothetical protein E8E11_006940 [Didymella keratinophila]|nr:hypothetical protein E8E11_006940 [Didymella keratinophila]
MSWILLPEDTATIPDSWFQAQSNRKYRSAVHEVCHKREIAALQCFASGGTSVDEAAYAITQPISTTSIQDTDSYSDDCYALCHLWSLFMRALMQWPSSRTSDLIALLKAVSKIEDPIHRGEFLDDDDEEPVPWAELPYFNLPWSDTFWMTPGQIMRRATAAAAMQQALQIYVKQQDIESRLVAAGLVWDEKRAIRYLIRTLERIPTVEDERIATGDGDADDQLKLDMQIPAVHSWILHNGAQVYRDLSGMRDLQRRDIPSKALQFDRPIDRWTFWQR